MRSFAHSKRLAALLGAPALALGAPALALGASAMVLRAPGGRPNGRGLPTIVHGGGLTLTGVAVLAAVIVAAIVVAAIGWRLDQRRVARRQLAVELSAPDTSRGSTRGAAAQSLGRVGGEPAGARARRVAPREGEERR